MKDNLILIGFMGAGKTSVGLRLSQRNHMEFLDTDQLIQEKAGMSILDIFEKQGEEAFRRTETAVLLELLPHTENTLISAGGGLPLVEENRKLIRQLGTVVYLKVSPDTVLERLKGDTTRPLLAGGNVRDKVETLLKARGPLYQAAAHVVVEADKKDIGRLMEEVEEAVASLGDRRS